MMLLLSLAEVLQMADADDINSDRGFFQRYSVLLIAELAFFGILPRHTEILLHYYIVYAAFNLLCCYNSRILLLQYRR
jgi:hypothetical protein